MMIQTYQWLVKWKMIKSKNIFVFWQVIVVNIKKDVNRNIAEKITHNEFKDVLLNQ